MPHRFDRGDKVICNPAETPPRLHNIVYIIDRFGPVSAFLSRVGGGKGLCIHPNALLPAPGDDAPAAAPGAAALVPAPLILGAAVTVSSPRWRGSTGLHIVLADYGATVKLVELGGNDHKYWPRVPRTWLTDVDRGALLAAVAALTKPASRPR